MASRRASSRLLGSAASECAQRLDLAMRGRRLANPRAPKDHDRLMDLVLLKQQFRLEIVDLQAHTAHAILSEKVRIIVGATVARAVQDRLHTAQGLGIFLSCLRLLPRQRFTPLVRVRGRWNWVLLVHRLQIIPISSGPATPAIEAWPRSARACEFSFREPLMQRQRLFFSGSSMRCKKSL